MTSWLFQSRTSGLKKILITSRRSKGIGVMVKNRYIANDAKPHGITSSQGATEKHLFLHAKQMGAWLSIWGTMVTGTVLTATYFRAFKCSHYNIKPLNLQNKFVGCMQTILVHHALICPNGVLVIACHNEIRGDIFHLIKQAFPPNFLHSNLIIQLIRSISE